MGGGTEVLQNLNPRLFDKCDDRAVTEDDWNENVTDEFDSREVFDLIRHINDPEHPLTLEELNVVDVNRITFPALLREETLMGGPLYAKGEQKAKFLEGVLNRPVTNIEALMCPSYNILMESKEYPACATHDFMSESLRSSCSVSKALALCKYIRDNDDATNLFDSRPRFATFGNLKKDGSYSRLLYLAQRGFVNSVGRKEMVWCVWCEEIMSLYSTVSHSCSI